MEIFSTYPQIKKASQAKLSATDQSLDQAKLTNFKDELDQMINEVKSSLEKNRSPSIQTDELKMIMDNPCFGEETLDNLCNFFNGQNNPFQG